MSADDQTTHCERCGIIVLTRDGYGCNGFNESVDNPMCSDCDDMHELERQENLRKSYERLLSQTAVAIGKVLERE